MKHTYLQTTQENFLGLQREQKLSQNLSESPLPTLTHFQTPIRVRTKSVLGISPVHTTKMAEQAEKFFFQKSKIRREPSDSPSPTKILEGLPHLKLRILNDSPSPSFRKTQNDFIKPLGIKNETQYSVPSQLPSFSTNNVNFEASRDVSYILDQKFNFLSPTNKLKLLKLPDTSVSTINNSKQTVDEYKTKDLLSTMGIIEATVTNYPETIEELNQVRLTLKSPNNELSYKIFLKNDIFKLLPNNSHFSYESIKQKEDSPTNVQGQCPEKGLGIPSSRYDAIVLHKWFDSMRYKISKDSSLSNEIKVELLQTANYICIKEIVRQISVHCVERGNLLWQLWKSYLNIIEDIYISEERKIEKLIQNNDDRIFKLHEHYEDELKEFADKFNNVKSGLEINIQKLEDQLNIAHNNSEFLTSQNTKLEAKCQELSRHDSELDHYKAKYKEFKDANTSLNSQILELKESLQISLNYNKTKYNKPCIENGVQAVPDKNSSEIQATNFGKSNEYVQTNNHGQNIRIASIYKIPEYNIPLVHKPYIPRPIYYETYNKNQENPTIDAQKSENESIMQNEIDWLRMELANKNNENAELHEERKVLLTKIEELEKLLARKSIPLDQQKDNSDENSEDEELNENTSKNERLPIKLISIKAEEKYSKNAITPKRNESDKNLKRGSLSQKNSQSISSQTPRNSFGTFCEFKLSTKYNRSNLANLTGRKLIAEIKQLIEKDPSQFQAPPLKSLCKVITSLYQARINYNKIISPQIDFASFVYSEFINRYGLKSVSEQKLIQVF